MANLSLYILFDISFGFAKLKNMIVQKLRTVLDWAKIGTIRKQFGIDIGKNAVHGSDSADAARREIRFFFADREK